MHNKSSIHLIQYNSITIILLLINFQFSLAIELPKLISYNTIALTNFTQEVRISFTVEEKDFVYKDFIIVSVHEPTVKLSPWKTDLPPIATYDPLFKTTKQIFAKDFTLSVLVTTNAPTSQPIYFYCSYYRNSDKKIKQFLIPIIFNETEYSNSSTYQPESCEPTTSYTKKTIPLFASMLDFYFFIATNVFYHLFLLLQKTYRNYFLVLIIIALILLFPFYFLKKSFEKKIIFKELIESIISLLIICIIIGELLSLYLVSSPLIATTSTVYCSAIIGLFSIKKSAQLQLTFLSTIYSIVGILSLASSIFFVFKAGQAWQIL